MSAKSAACSIAVVCLFGWISTPASATVTYPDLLGAGSGEVDFVSISESSTTDPEPLYGSPTRIGNQLLFFPQTFVSSSANGTADTTSGTLQVRIVADAGYYLEVIEFVEYGDYTLAGAGTAATSATINGMLLVTDLDTGNVLPVDEMAVTPAAPYELPDDTFGTFSAATQLDLTGYGITQVMVVLNNNLQTTSEAGTTSLIQKKVVDGPAVGIIVIPEPMALAFLVVGAATVLRRRKG